MNWAMNHDTGKNPMHYKEWYGGDGRYWVFWRDQVCGVAVPPCYLCWVRACDASWSAQPTWESLEPHLQGYSPFYPTLEAAKNACEKHAGEI